MTSPLENKRDDFAFGGKNEAAYVSPEGLAQWTLCEQESDGTNDVMNIRKMEDIKKHFVKEYASNENTSCETNHSTQSEKPRRPDNQFGFKKIKKERV